MKKVRLLLAVSALAFTASSAHAQYVVGATSVTASAGLPPGYSAPTALNSIINQSGLSANYNSGVTNFASFVSTTTADYTCCFPELGGVAGMPAWITFDLGSVMNVSRIVVWNQVGSASLVDFNLVGDNGALGAYSMPNSSQDSPAPAQVFSFAATNTRYITMNITSNAGYSGGTMMNEVAFEAGAAATVVPEPSSMMLTMAGLIAVVGVARRRGRNNTR